MDFIYALDGVEQVRDETLHARFRNANGTIEFAPPSLRVGSQIGLAETIFGEHLRHLQSCVTTAVPKLTIPSPSTLRDRGGRASIGEDV